MRVCNANSPESKTDRRVAEYLLVLFCFFKSFSFSLDQDEEMDTSPLAKPFFTIDKEGAAGDGEQTQQGEGDDSSEEEEPGSQGQEEEEDDDVTVTQKPRRVQNGNHVAESEESSDDDEEEPEEAIRRLRVAPAARCQTVTS